MGSGFWFGLLFLVLHLALCGALWLLARSRALEVEGYFLPVALLVPVWGPLCVVLLHTSHRLTGGQLLDRTLEKLRINEEIYKNILVAENEEKDTVVPLEEALLVNSPAQKRKLILSVLTDDPRRLLRPAAAGPDGRRQRGGTLCLHCTGANFQRGRPEAPAAGAALCRRPRRRQGAGRILRLSGKLSGRRFCAGQGGGDSAPPAGAAA